MLFLVWVRLPISLWAQVSLDRAGTPPSTLFRIARLLGLWLRGLGVLHLLVAGCLVTLGSLAGLLFGGLLRSLLGLNARLHGLAVGLDLLEVSLDDGASLSTELLQLGDVDALGGILALVIKPVLWGKESASVNH